MFIGVSRPGIQSSVGASQRFRSFGAGFLTATGFASKVRKYPTFIHTGL